MQKIIKIGFITYFAILLIILWTYISYSDTSVDLRMNVGSTLATTPDHPTTFAVWAYEKDRHYDFSKWTLATVLIPTSAIGNRSCTTAFAVDYSEPYSEQYFVTHDMRDVHTLIARFNDFPDDYELFLYDKPFLRNLYRFLKGDHAIVTHLSSDGRAMISIPFTQFHAPQLLKDAMMEINDPVLKLPNGETHIFPKPSAIADDHQKTRERYTACFLLIDPDYNLQKEISFALDPVQETIHLASMRSVTWAEPNPFLLNEKAEILIDVNGHALETTRMEETVIRITDDKGAEPTALVPEDTKQVVVFAQDDAKGIVPAEDQERANNPFGVSLQSIPNALQLTSSYITTKVNFGRVGIAQSIPVSSLGLTKATLTVETPSDLQFDYEGATFYGSFTPNDKPLRIEVPHPVMIPGEPLTLNLQTIVGDNDIYLDYYYYDQWLGRSITHTDSTHSITLKNTPKFDIFGPQIIILSGCLSSWDCRDTAQRVALIAFHKPISLRVQAIFALKTYYEATFENEKNKAAAGLLYRRVLTNPKLSPEELTLARDYALARIASGIPATEPSIVARTEPTDKQAKLDAKANHRAKANPILVFMIAAGIMTFILAAYRSRINVNQFNVDHDPEFAIREAQNDKLKRILFYIILFILGISVAGGLYYMMQIL